MILFSCIWIHSCLFLGLFWYPRGFSGKLLLGWPQARHFSALYRVTVAILNSSLVYQSFRWLLLASYTDWLFSFFPSDRLINEHIKHGSFPLNSLSEQPHTRTSSYLWVHFSLEPEAAFSLLKMRFPMDTKTVIVMYNPLLNTAPCVTSPAHLSRAAQEGPGPCKVHHLAANGMTPTFEICIPESLWATLTPLWFEMTPVWPHNLCCVDWTYQCGGPTSCKHLTEPLAGNVPHQPAAPFQWNITANSSVKILTHGCERF